MLHAICEMCFNYHDASYGSGRFCSAKCARGFSSKEKRQEINTKVSKTMTGKPHPHVYCHKNIQDVKSKASESIKKWHDAKLAYVDFSKAARMTRKRMLLKEQDNKCAICKRSFVWLGAPLMSMQDHIDGNRKNNSRENARLVCPNCHSQTNTFGVRNVSASGRARMADAARKVRAMHPYRYYVNLKCNDAP